MQKQEQEQVKVKAKAYVQKFKRITQSKTGLDVTCQHCNYRWLYCGVRERYITCPSCQTKVTLTRVVKK